MVVSLILSAFPPYHGARPPNGTTNFGKTAASKPDPGDGGRLDLASSKAFDVWFVPSDEGLTVTRFEGGGWDEKGQKSMRGR
jgi:hypothetical protein